jgi:hypothetical protein
MATVNNTLQTIMDNPLVIGLISIALTVYGPRLSPKLPDFIRNAFNNSFFRLIVLVLVIFIGSRNIRLSLVLAILFMVLMSITNNQNIKEDVEQQINEYYANYNLFGTTEHLEGGMDPMNDTPINNEDPEEHPNGPKNVEHLSDDPTPEEAAQLERERIKGGGAVGFTPPNSNEYFDGENPNGAMNNENPQDIMDEEREYFENPVPLPQPLQDYRQPNSNSNVSRQNRNMNNVNQSNVNFSNSNIKVMNQMANDPKFGLSNKCRVYFNNLNNNSESCLNEFENKLMDNPELSKDFYGNINEANRGSVYGNGNDDNERPMPNENVQNIQKQISQACKAFKKMK